MKSTPSSRHWRATLYLTVALLTVWLLVGPVLSILLADWLNDIVIGGFPLGFWFAQQGSIVVFVLLILIYAIAMNSLDNRYRRETRRQRDVEAKDEKGGAV